jgi:hypothetical protein
MVCLCLLYGVDSIVESAMYCESAATRPPSGTESPSTLDVTVVYTSVSETATALERAGELGSRLHASLQILVPVVVPYPLDLASPPVDGRIATRRLKTVANGTGIPTLIHFVYCRIREEAVERSLPPHSIVVICWRRRWAL